MLLFFIFYFSHLNTDYSKSVRAFHHELYKNIDSSLGPDTMPVSGRTHESSFKTHLPIVILDMNGKQPPDIYKTLGSEQARTYANQNQTNPWIDMHITVIDNRNHSNMLTDEPTFVNDGLIKLRGNSSRAFKKHQYGIKFFADKDKKQELEYPFLGMNADENWILSNSILDSSQIRNYVALTIGGVIVPYTSDVRFCEVFTKEEGKYIYQGLYLAVEPIKRGKDHVNIAKYKKNDLNPSYIICRDRKNYTQTTLSTWASENNICYGWFTFKYPKERDLTDRFVSQVERDLSHIEHILYSDNLQEFLTYSQFIDVPSFVDYFIVNEFFMNYDAGDNSTYYYKDYARKLTMGPLWDYDNCWDNYKLAAGDAEYIVFKERPWFERLVRDPHFVQKLDKRYKQLRKTILSQEYLDSYIDDTVAFLGNAVLRDRSRWSAVYQKEHMLATVKEGRGYIINRNRDTYQDEIIRLKDMAFTHGKWLDNYMVPFLSEYEDTRIAQKTQTYYSIALVIFVICFITLLYIITLKMKES